MQSLPVIEFDHLGSEGTKHGGVLDTPQNIDYWDLEDPSLPLPAQNKEMWHIARISRCVARNAQAQYRIPEIALGVPSNVYR